MTYPTPITTTTHSEITSLPTTTHPLTYPPSHHHHNHHHHHHHCFITLASYHHHHHHYITITITPPLHHIPITSQVIQTKINELDMEYQKQREEWRREFMLSHPDGYLMIGARP